MNSGEEIVRHDFNQVDVVLSGYLIVGLFLEQFAQLQIVMCADDRAAGNARDDLDVTEHVQLGQLSQNTNMIKRSAKTASRKPQPDFSTEGGLQGCFYR